jgi:hypothetical protein
LPSTAKLQRAQAGLPAACRRGPASESASAGPGPARAAAAAAKSPARTGDSGPGSPSPERGKEDFEQHSEFTEPPGELHGVSNFEIFRTLRLSLRLIGSQDHASDSIPNLSATATAAAGGGPAVIASARARLPRTTSNRPVAPGYSRLPACRSRSESEGPIRRTGESDGLVIMLPAAQCPIWSEFVTVSVLLSRPED